MALAGGACRLLQYFSVRCIVIWTCCVERKRGTIGLRVKRVISFCHCVENWAGQHDCENEDHKPESGWEIGARAANSVPPKR
jgi:hypothetical protein